MMTGKIRNRLERLELLSTPPDRRQIEEDAQIVRDRLLSRACALTASDATKTIADRLQMSCAQHVAWALRFDPEPDVPNILALHGVRSTQTGEPHVRPAH